VDWDFCCVPRHSGRRGSDHQRGLKMDFKTFSRTNWARCLRWHDPQSWSVAEWTNALAGEAGEACNKAKKLLRLDQDLKGPNGYHNNGASRDELIADLGDELADIVIYADLTAQRLGIDLGAAVAKKFNETSEKYGFPERL
jgi:NTP pyrophosphatase (non-canonical NTP hydrolase)